MAEWPAELEWWYPGTIVAIEGDLFDVIYDDGDRANLTLEQVKPLTIGVGTRVYANWKAGGIYYPGRVAQAVGEAIFVEYDDGDKENTAVRMIRINQSDL